MNASDKLIHHLESLPVNADSLALWAQDLKRLSEDLAKEANGLKPQGMTDSGVDEAMNEIEKLTTGDIVGGGSCDQWCFLKAVEGIIKRHCVGKDEYYRLDGQLEDAVKGRGYMPTEAYVEQMKRADALERKVKELTARLQ